MTIVIFELVPACIAKSFKTAARAPISLSPTMRTECSTFVIFPENLYATKNDGVVPLANINVPFTSNRDWVTMFGSSMMVMLLVVGTSIREPRMRIDEWSITDVLTRTTVVSPAPRI